LERIRYKTLKNKTQSLICELANVVGSRFQLRFICLLLTRINFIQLFAQPTLHKRL